MQEEKTVREKDFDDQMSAVKLHYDDLTKAFDEFSSNTELSAENLKNIQILKESEKNSTILGMLDQFVMEYQARLDQIAAANAGVGGTDVSGVVLAPGTGTQLSQKELDLYTYNVNKDAWAAAKARGDTETMRLLNEQNEEIRKKYGIDKDTGKLQHFSDGGTVKGPKGAAVPVIAHAGEVILNDFQQGNLFKLLNFRLPSLEYSMPQFTPATTNNNQTTIDNRVTITRGDTYIEDQATASAYWSEEENFVRRLNSRGGKQ
ncbi:hypothetical protein D3C75_448000 [compost metagenome]